jgi:hypothetical protein
MNLSRAFDFTGKDVAGFMRGETVVVDGGFATFSGV